MNSSPWPSLLHCVQCREERVLTREQMIERLGEIKMLRRNVEPEADVLAELWQSAVARFRCPSCGHVGMTATHVENETNDWCSTRTCEACAQPIPVERLEALPDTTLCADCQSLDERGELSPAEVDYCPHCGDIMRLRTSARGGTTSYRQFCPSCGR